jgi:tRNA modification GTPase
VARWITRCTTELRSALNEISALIAEAPHQAQGRLQVLLNTVETGRRLIEGSRIVLSGPPNAGKSTLANRLFERPWSTESHVPGTTRDWVDQPIAIDGVPIELIDTAGIREAGDALEHAAIERSRAQVTAADVVIWVIDGAEQHAAATFVPASHALRADIVVINKTDLINDASRVDAVRQGVSSCNSLPLTSIIALSAKSGVGIDILRCAVTSAVLQGSGWPAPGMWPGILYEELQQAATLLPRDPTAAHRLIGRCSEP